ncbi:UBA domain protein Dph1, partial [Reticulomyxa filosa]
MTQEENASISLTVKTTNDERFQITVSSNATVLETKKAIEKSSSDNIEPDFQRLIYKGQVLKDDKSLNDYSVQDGHTIILVRSRHKAKKEETSKRERESVFFVVVIV